MNIRNKAGKKTTSYQLARYGYRVVRGRDIQNDFQNESLLPDGFYITRSRFCSCITGSYGPIVGRLLDIDDDGTGDRNVIRVLSDSRELSRFVRAASRCSVNGSKFTLKR